MWVLVSSITKIFYSNFIVSKIREYINHIYYTIILKLKEFLNNLEKCVLGVQLTCQNRPDPIQLVGLGQFLELGGLDYVTNIFLITGRVGFGL